MECYLFTKESGRKITNFSSDFMMSRVIETTNVTNIGCLHLDENGVVGYHQAVVPQLLLILNGEGGVRNEKEEYIQVVAGDTVFLKKDEWLETKTDTGLTSIVIGSEELIPAKFMLLKQ